MASPKNLGKVFGAVALFFSTYALAAPAPGIAVARADDDNHWVPTWTSMPQEVEQNNLPPSPFVSRISVCGGVGKERRALTGGLNAPI